MTKVVSDQKAEINLKNNQYYCNREISHLAFNQRVLAQALVEDIPLLERLRFCCIFSSNLDEFFEVRVANIRERIEMGVDYVGPDGINPKQLLAKIHEATQPLVVEQYRILNEVLIPKLADEGIHFVRRNHWNDPIRKWVKSYFRNHILPVVSPIGLDPAHPFPRLVNKSLNFIVSLEGKDAFGRDTGLAIIPAPRSLPRLIKIPETVAGSDSHYVFLSSMIHEHADDLFPGMKVTGCYQFRVTRNADLDFETDDVADLASAVKGELLARRYGDGVRLEVADNCPDEMIEFLLREFHLNRDDLYRVNGPVNLSRLLSVVEDDHDKRLFWPEFVPGIPKRLRKGGNIFQAIREKDILLHHPFESFSPVVDLIRQAAVDPDVLAIKQTLYRTGSTSDVVDALVDAAKNGKEVTVVIELRARFDEADNIALANRLQEAGCVVVYGVVGYKTHAKMILVVRKEGNQLKRYCHLGTGNYHQGNARIYTDYSLLTAEKEICDDVAKVFQQLTGMGKALRIKKLWHAPFTLHDQILNKIDEVAEAAKQGKKTHIVVKVNGLTEPKVIRTLYRASQAGVKIDLIVRGMCRLIPGMKGISENIRLRSIIGRFLEHTRVFSFTIDKEQELYLSSADWMDRNLLKRVEVAFPILDDKLKKRINDELNLYLNDNRLAWQQGSDLVYIKDIDKSKAPLNAQDQLIESLGAISLAPK